MAAKKKPKRQKPPAKRKTKKGKTKRNTGIPFEKRARDAVQYLHRDLVATHNEDLVMRYDRLRQFDVTLKGTALDLRKVYEAKDHGGRVPFGLAEAFETKVRELKDPPLDGAGMISSHGFQEGPIERARALGDSIMVREMYQLRPVAEEDWEGLVRSFQFAVMTRTLAADDVLVTLANDKPAPALHLTADRQTSFIYDESGRIIGNLLDLVNEKLRTVQTVAPPEVAPTEPTLAIELASNAHIRIGTELFRVLAVSMKTKTKALDSMITADASTAARDTLIDCLSGQKRIIPDPEKAISASRNGLDLALTFENQGGLSLETLQTPPSSVPDDARDVAALANAIKLQMMLRTLRGEFCEPTSSPEVDALTKALKDATDLFAANEYESAEAAYWKTCAVATSLLALVNLTFLLQKRGEMNGALNLAMRTIELFPLEVNGYANAAVVLMDLGRFEEARIILDHAKVLHAGRAELMKLEAQWLTHEQDWVRAERAYSHLAQMDPSDAAACLGLALCESQLGRHQAAAWDASQAIGRGLHPGSRGIMALRILIRARDWTGAESAGDRLLQHLEPADADRQQVQLLTATACYETGHFQKARELSRALTIEDPSRQYLDGLLDHQDGEFDSGAENFESYCEQRPDDWAGWRNLSLCLSKAGKHPEAYRALLRPVFEGSKDPEYWTVRLVAALRAGEGAAAFASGQEAAAAGVDCAKLFMELSRSVVAAGNLALGVELRRQSMQHPTIDGTTLAERAIDHTYESARGTPTGVDLEGLLAEAEASGAEPGRLAFAQLLVAIHRSDAAAIEARLPRALDHLSHPERNALASEAMSRRRCHLALKLLGSDGPTSIAAVGQVRFAQPDAIKALALMHVGRMQEALQLEARVRVAEAHPLHPIALAYMAYGRGAVQAAIALLDESLRMTRQPSPLELPLRAACLAETGQYGALADLLRERCPQLPVTQAAASWASTPTVNPLTIVGLEVSDPHVVRALKFAQQMNPEAEHVGVMVRAGRIGRLVSPVYGWETWFKQVADFGDNSIPLLVRMAPVAWRTVQRLLGPTIDTP